MESGRLNEIITVERPTIYQDGYGGNDVVWNEVIKTRADVQFTSGNRATENNEIVFNYNKIFTVRYYHKIDEKDRVIWNGKKYRILNLNYDRDKQYLQITTELINE